MSRGSPQALCCQRHIQRSNAPSRGSPAELESKRGKFYIDPLGNKVLIFDLEMFGLSNSVCGQSFRPEYAKNVAAFNKLVGTDKDPPIKIGHPNRVTMFIGWVEGTVVECRFEEALMTAVDARIKEDGSNRTITTKVF